MSLPVAILGAGPAGLTAAYALGKKKVPVVVLEADPEYVGGISRTGAGSFWICSTRRSISW